MSAPLGTFTPRVQQTGDRLQARAAIGRPLLLQVTGFDGAKQTTDQNTKAAVVKPAIFVDVWDFIGGPAQPGLDIPVQPPNTVYIGAMWMSGPIVDNLKDFVGGPPMPVRITSTKNPKTNFNYLSVVPLGDPNHDVDPQGPMQLQQVAQAFNADPTRFDRERAARAQAALAQQHAAASQQSGFQPMAQPSVNGQPFPVAAAQAQQQLQPTPGFAQTAQQYGLPMNGQAPQFQQPVAAPGAIANTPAQVAAAWTPADNILMQAQQLVAQGMTSDQAIAQLQAAAQNTPHGMVPAPNYQAQSQAGNQMMANSQQAAQPLNQYPPAGFAAPQQPPAAAQAMPGGMQVQNSDVAAILQGLGAQPQQ